MSGNQEFLYIISEGYNAYVQEQANASYFARETPSAATVSFIATLKTNMSNDAANVYKQERLHYIAIAFFQYTVDQEQAAGNSLFQKINAQLQLSLVPHKSYLSTMTTANMSAAHFIATITEILLKKINGSIPDFNIFINNLHAIAALLPQIHNQLFVNPEVAALLVTKHLIPYLKNNEADLIIQNPLILQLIKNDPAFFLSQLLECNPEKKHSKIWMFLIQQGLLPFTQIVNAQTFSSYWFNKHAVSGWSLALIKSLLSETLLTAQQKASLFNTPCNGYTALQYLAANFSQTPALDTATDKKEFKESIIALLQLGPLSIAQETKRSWYLILSPYSKESKQDVIDIFNAIPVPMLTEIANNKLFSIKYDLVDFMGILGSKRDAIDCACTLEQRLIDNGLNSTVSKDELIEIKRRLAVLNALTVAPADIAALQVVLASIKRTGQNKDQAYYIDLFENGSMHHSFVIALTVRYMGELASSASPSSDADFERNKNQDLFAADVQAVMMQIKSKVLEPAALKELQISIEDSMRTMIKSNSSFNTNQYHSVDKFVLFLKRLSMIRTVLGEEAFNSLFTDAAKDIFCQMTNLMWLSATPAQQSFIVEAYKPTLMSISATGEQTLLLSFNHLNTQLRDIAVLYSKRWMKGEINTGCASFISAIMPEEYYRDADKRKAKPAIEDPNIIILRLIQALLKIIDYRIISFTNETYDKSFFKELVPFLSALLADEQYKTVRAYLRQDQYKTFFKQQFDRSLSKLTPSHYRGVARKKVLKESLELFADLFALDIKENILYISLMRDSFSIENKVSDSNKKIITDIITHYQTQFAESEPEPTLKSIVSTCTERENNAFVVTDAHSDALVLTVIENQLLHNTPVFCFDTYKPIDPNSFKTELNRIYAAGLALAIATAKSFALTPQVLLVSTAPGVMAMPSYRLMEIHAQFERFLNGYHGLLRFGLLADSKNVQSYIDILFYSGKFTKEEILFSRSVVSALSLRSDNFNGFEYFINLQSRDKDTRWSNMHHYLTRFNATTEQKLNIFHSVLELLSKENNYLLNSASDSQCEKIIHFIIDKLASDVDLLQKAQQTPGFMKVLAEQVMLYPLDATKESVNQAGRVELSSLITEQAIQNACIPFVSKKKLAKVFYDKEYVTSDANDNRTVLLHSFKMQQPKDTPFRTICRLAAVAYDTSTIATHTEFLVTQMIVKILHKVLYTHCEITDKDLEIFPEGINLSESSKQAIYDAIRKMVSEPAFTDAEQNNGEPINAVTFTNFLKLLDVFSGDTFSLKLIEIFQANALAKHNLTYVYCKVSEATIMPEKFKFITTEFRRAFASDSYKLQADARHHFLLAITAVATAYSQSYDMVKGTYTKFMGSTNAANTSCVNFILDLDYSNKNNQGDRDIFFVKAMIKIMRYRVLSYHSSGKDYNKKFYRDSLVGIMQQSMVYALPEEFKRNILRELTLCVKDILGNSESLRHFVLDRERLECFVKDLKLFEHLFDLQSIENYDVLEASIKTILLKCSSPNSVSMPLVTSPKGSSVMSTHLVSSSSSAASSPSNSNHFLNYSSSK